MSSRSRLARILRPFRTVGSIERGTITLWHLKKVRVVNRMRLSESFMRVTLIVVRTGERIHAVLSVGRRLPVFS